MKVLNTRHSYDTFGVVDVMKMEHRKNLKEDQISLMGSNDRSISDVSRNTSIQPALEFVLNKNIFLLI